MKPVIDDRFEEGSETVQEAVRFLVGVANLLLEKNEKYGDSAASPMHIFSSASTTEQIRVRIDDKLSRLKSSGETNDEDTVKDLVGYLALLRAVTTGPQLRRLEVGDVTNPTEPGQETSSTPEPGYRFLVPGDVLQAGDEWFNGKIWKPADLNIGPTVKPGWPTERYRRATHPEPPASPQGHTYRFLMPGDVVQDGDEIQDCRGAWRTVQAVGWTVDPNILNKYRRRV